MGKPAFFLLAFLCAFASGLVGCGKKALIPLPSSSTPEFIDDLQYANLDRAIEQSLIYLRKRPETSRVAIYGQTYPRNHFIRSLEFFRNLLSKNPSPDLLSEQVSTYFDIFQAAGTEGYNPQRTMLVTGYYQPLFAGSLEQVEPYIHPVYGIPGSLVLRHSPGPGMREIGRLDGAHFRKYWTRGEIESLGIARGSELVYLKDPVDAFLLHIQGSGLIQLPDGTVRGIHYAMKNGRQYRSIGKYMVETGRLGLEEAGIDTIRRYLNAHPEERETILQHNDSFIFFEWTTGHGAIGNLGRELTAERSIAVDQSLFPAGALSFLRSRKPVIKEGRIINWIPFNRFVLVQDTGSAIRGSGRVDLFCGTGEQAGLVAGRMKEAGALYFLLLKKQFL